MLFRSLPMKKPVLMAGVRLEHSENFLIRLEADDGTVGWGEASSAPQHGGSTVQEMMQAWQALQARVTGADAMALGGSGAGRELRWVLLGLLAAVLIGEQLISLRLSYHPEVAR